MSKHNRQCSPEIGEHKGIPEIGIVTKITKYDTLSLFCTWHAGPPGLTEFCLVLRS